MKYLCLIHNQASALDELSPAERDTLRREALVHHDDLRQNGHELAGARLQPSGAVAVVSVREGLLSIAEGSLAGEHDTLDGFHLIDARDFNDAVRLATKMPQARLGCIEIRPVDESEPPETP